MAWVEVHQSLRTHPKVKRLAKRLGIRRAEAIGLLVNLWTWAIDHKGRLNGCDTEDVADACLWEGDAPLLKILTEVGWVDKDGRIHDYDEMGDRLLRQSRERQARHRKSVT